MGAVFWYVLRREELRRFPCSCSWLGWFWLTVQVAGRIRKELEFSRVEVLPQWIGQDTVDFFQESFKIIMSSGGYNLSGKQ